MDERVKLLVVEDDPILGKSIATGLTQEGYLCQLARTGADAVQMTKDEDFQVIVLDLALDDESALGVLRHVRESNENSNVIILTPLEYRQERKAGLEAGADDFMIKPFAMNEMRARVEAALIRSRSRPRTLIEVGPLQMNLTTRKVTNGDAVISLTPTEFRILEILMRNQGKPVTRRMLCEFLWDPQWEGVTNVIEVHINRLRTKLRIEGDQQFIQTIRGSGYMLKWEGDTPAAAALAPSNTDRPEELA
jgi:two-component system, OmpR family, response regulator